MFLIDGSAAPQRKELTGRPGETGNVLTLAQTQEIGLHGIPGCTFPLGSTGVFAVGDIRTKAVRQIVTAVADGAAAAHAAEEYLAQI